MTRVELHKAVWPDDYDTLHASMKKKGFFKTIYGSNGVTYELPTAEYYRETHLAIETVIEQAKEAATEVNKKFSVVVSEVANVMWDYLEPIK